jgi:hypothetical protein
MDLDVQVRAFVALAAKRGQAWLENLRDQAALAVAAGDVEVTTLSFEGGSGGGARKFNAQMLLEVTQLAFEQVTGTAEAKVVYTDFSSSGRTVNT